MKFALHFGNICFPDAAGAARVARLAEQAGFDTLLAIDHVVLPQSYDSVYPYSPDGRMPAANTAAYPDPLIWMAFALAATTRLKLMTGVIILPQREPLVLAKQMATLDMMSQGRVELGIGVGWLREEFAAIGVPFEKRGKRADEYLGAMRALWAGDGASYQGEFVNFTDVNSNPKPVRGNIPIVIGGHSEAAARRAGRLGDAFFPSIGSQHDIFPLFDTVARAAEAVGRDPASIEHITGCPGALGPDPLAAVAERASRGIGRVVLPLTAFLPNIEESLPRFGKTVIAPSRR
jgi:probable F420-dependent oxidoreductase